MIYLSRQIYDKQLSELEALFKALADATRLRILGLLLTGEVCVCHIHESLRIPQPKASRHLAYLRRAGLVETRRDGCGCTTDWRNRRDPVLGTIADAVRTRSRTSTRAAGRRAAAEEDRLLPADAAETARPPACCARPRVSHRGGRGRVSMGR